MDKNKQMRGVAPAGWALVPVEPTPEMVREVEHADRLGAVWTAESVYKAMLTAAPPAPAAEAPQVDELAQFIRQIDGNHRMGAGVLAEHICEWLSAAKTKEPT